MTVLCSGIINSQTTTPANQSLSGTQTGYNEYEALNSIQSTQVINSGTTTYTAGNEIVLKPGFHAKPGSKFEAVIDDVSNRLTIMTYNLWSNDKISEHAEVITKSGADIIAIQEMRKTPNFNSLKNKTGLNGEFYVLKGGGWAIFEWMIPDYGIALLWKPTLGTPIIHKKYIDIPGGGSDNDSRRGYIIAEFNDYCFISTHYSLNPEQRIEMTNKILNETIVQSYKNSGKPVYIGGDFNEQPHEPAISMFTNPSNGFEVLNDTFSPTHATFGGKYIDLILEHNTNPNRAVIDRGIPSCIPWPTGWITVVSDHYPYYVKVKFK